MLDFLFGRFAFYRRLRGGRWERVCEIAVTGGYTFWERVDLPTPSRKPGRLGEAVIAREDHRR